MSAPITSRTLREATALLAALALVLAGLAAAVRPHPSLAAPAFAGLPICAPSGSDDGNPASPEGCQHCILCKLAALPPAGPASGTPTIVAGRQAATAGAAPSIRFDPAFEARGPPLS